MIGGLDPDRHLVKMMITVGPVKDPGLAQGPEDPGLNQGPGVPGPGLSHAMRKGEEKTLPEGIKTKRNLKKKIDQGRLLHGSFYGVKGIDQF